MLRTLEERRLNLDRSLEALLVHPETWGDNLHPYYYQNDAVRGVQAVTQRNKTASYVHMPTSSGKSEVMAGTVFALCQHAPTNDLPRIFIVEPTQKLVRDTRDRILKYFPKIPVGVYYSDEQDLDKPVTVITGDSFGDLLELGIIKPKETDYLLMDEAHRWLTDLRRGALKPFYKTTVITGFTATIEFNKLKALYRTLGEEAYSIGYTELIAKGHIGERANVIVGMKLPRNTDSKAERSAYSDAVRDIALHYQDSLEDNEGIIGDRTIVTHWRVNEARYTADLFNNDPEVRKRMIAATGNPNIIPAAVIYGGQKELDQIVEDFDAGKIGWLMGARIPGEGLNTKARHVITPERWSTLDIEQVGGRVRDKSAICRVFTILREDSGKRKSAFYADAIGAARITRDGVQYGLARPLEQLRLTHPPVGNLNIYNTPNEVASYIKSREPKPHNRGARYLGVSEMTKTLGAWQPEVEYIYSLLDTQYRTLPDTQKYLQVGDRNVPREFLRPAGNNGIAVYEDAAGIIQDIIGEYPERPETIITYTDVEPDLASSQKTAKFSGLIAATDQLFTEAGHIYAAATLPWKYGTSTQPSHTLSPPAAVTLQGIRIPFRYIGMYVEDNRVDVGIQEGVFARLLARQIPSQGNGKEAFEKEMTAAFGEGAYIPELVKQSFKRREKIASEGYINLDDSITRNQLDELWARKGEPGYVRIFKALPSSARTSDANGQAFLSDHTIQLALLGQQQKLRQPQWDVLISTLQTFPDRACGPVVDLADPVICQKLDELWTRKGRPGGIRIFNAVPDSAKTPDETGYVIFNTAQPIFATLYGVQQTLRQAQWNTLTSTLEAFPDRTLEPVVDLTDPSIRRQLDELRFKKGNPGCKRIFRALPDTAKTPNEYGEIFFSHPAIVNNILSGQRQKLQQGRWDMFVSTLGAFLDREVEPKVDLTDPAIRRQLDELWAKKGEPSDGRIFNALPALAKTRDKDGYVIFGSTQPIAAILCGKQKTLRQSQWNSLLATLGSFPDRVKQPTVDLTDPAVRRQLDELWSKKGKPGYIRVLKELPVSAKTPDENGDVIFGSKEPIRASFLGKQRTLRQNQWDILLATLETFPDKIKEPTVALTDPIIRRQLDELWEKKGEPGYKQVFKALPDTAKVPDKDGIVLFKVDSIVGVVLSGKQQKLRQSQWDILLATLETLPDRAKEPILDLTDPAIRRQLDELWTKKGNPGCVEIYAALPDAAKVPNGNGEVAYKAEWSLAPFLSRDQKTIRQSQWNFLIAALETFPDRTKEPTVDLADPNIRRPIDELWERKGKPGGTLIFNALPKPVEASETDEASFGSPPAISYVLVGGQKTIRKSKYETLIATLETFPDRTKEPIVDLTDPNTHRQLDELWNRKGKPSGKRIYNALPDSVKTPDANGDVVFGSPQSIQEPLSYGQKTLCKSKYDVLIATLETFPDRTLEPIVDLTDPAIQKQLGELWNKKGKPSGRRVFSSMPDTFKTPDENGEAVFGSPDAISVILHNKQKRLRQSQHNALITTLETFPDKTREPTVDLNDPMISRRLDELWKKKGQPGAESIFHALPVSAKTPDENDEMIFGSTMSIRGSLSGNKKTLRRSQYDVLIKTLETFPDKTKEPIVDLADQSTRHQMDELLAKKGNPGAFLIFNALPDAAKTPDKNGDVTFRSPQIIHGPIRGKQRTLRRSQWDTLIATLETMPDRPIGNKTPPGTGPQQS